MKPLSTSLAALCIAVISTPALAVDYLTVYTGSFDITDDENEAQFGIEYRADPFYDELRAVGGANINWDGGAYVYGGLNYDIYVMDDFVVTPNFVAGLYREGASKDLGGAIEFRSGIEAAYQFDNAARAGVAFNHISNASIYDKNPGAETLLFTYSHPLGALVDGVE